MNIVPDRRFARCYAAMSGKDLNLPNRAKIATMRDARLFNG